MRALIVPAALAGLLASACGASSNASSSTSSGGSDEAFKLGFIVGLTGNGGKIAPFAKVLQDNVKAANDRGGIHGHPIDLVTCDTQSNANGSIACAKRLVSEGVFAVLDFDTGPAGLPYFEKAGIADLNIGQAPEDATSPVSFMVNDISLAAHVGFTAIAKGQGCNSFATVSTNAASPEVAKQQKAGAESAAERYDIDYKGFFEGSQEIADVSSLVHTAVSKGIDCIGLQGLGAQEVSMLNALLKEPDKIKIITATTYLPPPSDAASLQPIVSRLGDRLVLVTTSESADATDNAGVKQWVTDQTKYGPKPPNLESVNATFWANLQLAIHAAEGVYPHVSADTVFDYLNHLTDYKSGIFPPVSFTDPDPDNPYGPRVFAAWVAPAKYTDGKTFPRSGPFISVIDGEKYTGSL